MNSQLSAAIASLNTAILGKPEELKLAVACLLGGGHLLVEDPPGMGKTTLALAMAKVFGMEFQRVQFTSDLLPADILGVSIFNSSDSSFQFQPGPIFAQLILADEVNRASPKTQSALLEAMEEKQVTSDGVTRALPSPFFVIATQNPLQQIGTFPLPESQLDRFLMRISLGYPANTAEKELLGGQDRREMLKSVSPSCDAAAVLSWQQEVVAVRTAPALLDYILALVHSTREHHSLTQGLSPRAGLALKRAAQAWAFLEGRSGVIPEDIQAVFSAVAGHRLISRSENHKGAPTAEEILNSVAIP